VNTGRPCSNGCDDSPLQQ